MMLPYFKIALLGATTDLSPYLTLEAGQELSALHSYRQDIGFVWLPFMSY